MKDEDPVWTFSQSASAMAGLAIALALVAYFALIGVEKFHADIRSSKAQERLADAAERAYPPHGGSCLPRPSLLSRAELKSIPPPDPEPCETLGPDYRLSRLHGFARLPTLGGTAVDQ